MISYEAMRSGSIDFLLAVTFGGQVFRWASRPATYTDADGNQLEHQGGVDTSIDFAFELLSPSPALISVPFSLVFPVSVAKMVASGFDFSAATGEFSIIETGASYESRIVLLRGAVVAPSYGVDGSPTSFSVRQNNYEDMVSIPGATARVTDETWDDYDDSVKGRFYPIVFGRPGVITDGSSEEQTTGSPGLLVDLTNRYLLVCDGRVASGNVHVIDLNGNAGDGSGESFSVTTTKDNNGRTVSVVQLRSTATGSAQVAAVEGHEYWVRWDEDGGIFASDSTAVMLGAGELIRYMSNLSSIQFDRGAIASVRPKLNEYRISGYIDEPTTPWGFIQDNLLPILPVSFIATGGGLTPIVFDRNSPAVAHLVDSPDISFSPAVDYDNGEIVNSIRIDYGTRGDSQELRSTFTISGDDREPGAHRSLIANTSQKRYGKREVTIQTAYVDDKATAQLIALDRLALYGLQRRRITANASWSHAYLKRGMCVTVTVESLYISAQKAVVESVSYSISGISLILLIVEDPARDTRA